MTAGRRTVWPVTLALLLALGAQGCGSVGGHRTTGHHSKPKAATKTKTQVTAFQGPLPALDAVQFLTSEQGFLAGQGLVLETSDGGRSWTQVYSGAQNIASLDVVSALSGYAVTGTGDVLVWSGGVSWQTLAGTPGPAAAIAPQGTAPTQFLTTGGVLFRADGPQGPWQQERLQGVQSISFTSPTDGYAVTGQGGATPEVWRTADGGATWQPAFTPPLNGGQGWTGSLAASGSDVWLLLTSDSGQVEHQPYLAYVSPDQGQHWQEVLGAPLFAAQGMYPKAAASLYGLQAGPVAAAGQSAYFVSWAPGSPQDTLALTATGDGGQSFSQLPLATTPYAETPYFFQPLGVYALEGGTIWLVGGRGGVGKVLVSTDGGHNWEAPAF
jgi:photosystem II stability/assembly factor-like uncharacterized protein